MAKNFQLLLMLCKPIAQEVLKEMDNHRIFVHSGAKITTDKPILYRWWFPVSIAEKIRDAYKAEKGEDILEHVEKRQLEDGNTYYALYFGKSNYGARRFHQHTQRKVYHSTLRKVIYGLLINKIYDESREGEVSDILQQCVCDWMEFPNKEDGKLVECIEGICIALGHYPLNVDGNPAFSDDWRDYVIRKRKITHVR